MQWCGMHTASLWLLTHTHSDVMFQQFPDPDACLDPVSHCGFSNITAQLDLCKSLCCSSRSHMPPPVCNGSANLHSCNAMPAHAMVSGSRELLQWETWLSGMTEAHKSHVAAGLGQCGGWCALPCASSRCEQLGQGLLGLFWAGKGQLGQQVMHSRLMTLSHSRLTAQLALLGLQLLNLQNRKDHNQVMLAWCLQHVWTCISAICKVEKVVSQLLLALCVHHGPRSSSSLGRFARAGQLREASHKSTDCAKLVHLCSATLKG